MKAKSKKMPTMKKFNLIPLIVSLVLIGVLAYFIKPNKLLTYAKAKFGVKNHILIYEVPKNTDGSKAMKDKLELFLQTRGISGTAYESNEAEYYVTLVPEDTDPKTEMDFGFVEILPEDFYRKMYDAKQVYFTRTLKIIEN